MKIIVAGKITKYVDLKVRTEEDGKKIYRATYAIKDGKSTAVVHVLGKNLMKIYNFLQVGSSYILEGFAMSLRHKHDKHKFVTNIYVTKIIKRIDDIL